MTKIKTHKELLEKIEKLEKENSTLKSNNNNALKQRNIDLLFENTNTGIIEWNKKGKIINCNTAAEKIFKYSKNEIIGNNISKIFLNSTAKKIFANSSKIKLATNQNLTRDNEKIICNWDNTIIFDNTNNIIGIISLITNITQDYTYSNYLEKTIEFEKTISEVSTLLIANKNNCINKVLKVIGNILNVNRTYIYIYSNNTII
ncbi:MAG: PAS domain-containing protein, partial [Bacteroidota bacterium]|nr:PAS domain-containing protein [Bacteroidota bacterium]